MGHLKGMKLNKWCPTLSHMFFADDAIFFLDGKLIECQNLANIVNQYFFAAGQAVNRNKSEIFFNKACPLSLQENLEGALRIPVIDRTSTYLGIPSDWGRSKWDMFAWILGRVNAKLEVWKESLLSKGGNEILLKIVIQAIPQYAMSIFRIPTSICKSIEQKVARFWWQRDCTKAGIH